VCYCNPFGLEASGERWMLVVGGVGSGGLLRHGLERKPLFFLRIVQSHRQLWATAIAYLQCGKKILVVVWAFYLSILSSGSPFILVHFSFSFYFNFFLGLNSVFGLIFGIQSLEGRLWNWKWQIEIHQKRILFVLCCFFITTISLHEFANESHMFTSQFWKCFLFSSSKFDFAIIHFHS